jgi:hypothetical protein
MVGSTLQPCILFPNRLRQGNNHHAALKKVVPGPICVIMRRNAAWRGGVCYHI